MTCTLADKRKVLHWLLVDLWLQFQVHLFFSKWNQFNNILLIWGDEGGRMLEAVFSNYSPCSMEQSPSTYQFDNNLGSVLTTGENGTAVKSFGESRHLDRVV